MVKDSSESVSSMQNSSAATHKDALLHEALLYIPKIIELLDRNPFSKTYGSFDRSYWHYRTADFPSGMYQEYVLPLAIVYKNNFPNNPFYQQPRIKEWVEAGIHFSRKSSHKDSSCDDYYPFEKAMGAVAFSLYASTESYLLLKLEDVLIVDFFKHRGDWLINHNETGILSNHHALVALCLQNVFEITHDQKYKLAAEEKIKELVSWQTTEGWFPEYEGCDPGYLSICVDFLAKYYQKSKDQNLIPVLKKAVKFMTYFSHPDGSYGGEYGSRNTFHFFPHGLEVLGKHIPEASFLVDRHCKALIEGNRAYTDDDRIFGHLIYNYLQAYLDFNEEREPVSSRLFEGEYLFKESSLFVKQLENHYYVLGLNKGGVFKYFKDSKLKQSDTGIALKTSEGDILVSHMIGDSQYVKADDHITVSGSFCVRPQILLKTNTFILFRLFLLFVGRFSRNLVRSLLQRKIIYSKKKVGVRYVRKFYFDKGLKVENKIMLDDKKIKINSIALSTDLTSIYVATSQPYQSSQLVPWTFLNDKIEELNTKKQITWQENYS